MTNNMAFSLCGCIVQQLWLSHVSQMTSSLYVHVFYDVSGFCWPACNTADIIQFQVTVYWCIFDVYRSCVLVISKQQLKCVGCMCALVTNSSCIVVCPRTACSCFMECGLMMLNSLQSFHVFCQLTSNHHAINGLMQKSQLDNGSYWERTTPVEYETCVIQWSGFFVFFSVPLP